ncbi:MAG TPA: hypothetical protein VMH20_08140 [Verrucomicrobiae bacterium]|nr:hypothetical protein [Verrucomicrobiae bacterium]
MTGAPAGDAAKSRRDQFSPEISTQAQANRKALAILIMEVSDDT